MTSTNFHRGGKLPPLDPYQAQKALAFSLKRQSPQLPMLMGLHKSCHKNVTFLHKKIKMQPRAITASAQWKVEN